MMQLHLHLAIAHPGCEMLEYIPWLRECFEEPATVEDGCFRIPEILARERPCKRTRRKNSALNRRVE